MRLIPEGCAMIERQNKRTEKTHKIQVIHATYARRLRHDQKKTREEDAFLHTVVSHFNVTTETSR
jgi:hypothetical protein